MYLTNSHAIAQLHNFKLTRTKSFYINIVNQALNLFISQLFVQVHHDYLQFLPIDKYFFIFLKIFVLHFRMILRHHCVLLIFASFAITVHSDVLGKQYFFWWWGNWENPHGYQFYVTRRRYRRYVQFVRLFFCSEISSKKCLKITQKSLIFKQYLRAA